MFKKKHIILIGVLTLIMMTFAGCSKETSVYSVEYKSGAISVKNGGKIVVTYKEDFNEKKYDKDELKKKVLDEIDEFNSKYSSDNGMSFASLKVKDNIASVKLIFKNVEEYLTYSKNYVDSEKKIEMFNGTYKDAIEEKHEFKGDLQKVKNTLTKTKKSQKSSKDTDIKDVDDIEDLYVVYTNQGTQIKIDGTLKYVSKNVEVYNGVAITSDKKESFIFYKPEK